MYVKRHNGNTLVNDRGLVIGIDFGQAFGKGVWQSPVPELVPFRLTRQMFGALSPLDSEALLKRSMTCAMFALRANKHVLKQTLHIFIQDPTMDWIVDSKDRQGQSAAVADGAALSAGSAGFLQERMQIFDSKLAGAHPCDVMLREVDCNTWVHVKKSRSGFESILNRCRNTGAAATGGDEGGARGRAGAFDSGYSHNKYLGAADQVDALVRLATHPAALSRIWEGWAPWK